MSYIQDVILQFQRFPTALERHTFCIDFGSSTTRILFDEKIIFEEATCVALHKESDSIVAIGQAAADLEGKSSQSIDVNFPIRRGNIADFSAAHHFLHGVFRTHQSFHTSNGLLGFLPKNIHVAVSPNATSIQKDFLKRLFKQTGFSDVTLLNKNTAILHQIRRSTHHSPLICSVDIGGMTTEICVFSQDQPVTERTIHVGGEDFTKEIIRVIRKQHSCEIGWQTAEKIKSALGRVPESSQDIRLSVIRGRDIVTSLPKTIQVSTTDLDQAFSQLAQDIWSDFREFCQDGDSELITTALSEGIFLTGGGSLLRGMDEFFMKKLQCPVHMSRTPFDDVIKGLGV